MSSIVIASGRLANLVARGVVTVGNQDSKYPAARLYDGLPSRPFRFLDHTAPRISLDAILITNGRLDVWTAGAPDGWTVSGTVAQETTDVHTGGGSAAKLTGAFSNLSRLVDVSAGEWLRFDAWAHGNATNQAALYVNDERTGRWLQPDGTWGGLAAAATTNSATYVQLAREFRVEPYLSQLAHESESVRLKIFLYHNSGTGDVFFDDVRLLSGVDMASVHGHNISPAWAATLQRSDDGTSWTTHHTFVKARPTFYGLLSSVAYYRHWRLDLAGGNTTVPVMWLGEWFLGQGRRLSRNPEYPLTLRHEAQQVRTATQVFLLEDEPRRVWAAPVTTHDLAGYQEMREEIFRRSGAGKHPLVLIPQDDDPEVCLYGRVRPTWNEGESFLGVRPFDLEVEELPLPTWA